MAAKNEEMDAMVTVNGQSVYVFFENNDYYLVSLYADGKKKFKADKVRPSK
jgi:hypothetical protein